MRKTTRWHPDSCGCVIDYSWDGDAAAADIVLRAEAITPCAAHAPILEVGGLDQTFEAILAQNRALAAKRSADQQS